MTNKKKRTVKITISILVVLLLIIVAVFFGFYITKINLTNAAVNYLCEKYNAAESEFELISYKKGHYYIDRTLFFEVRWSNYKWKYKYKDIIFNTERIDGKFYDDYQLNDLYEWTSEYLQKNISEDIIGMEVSSDMIYFHKNKFDAYNNIQSNEFNQNKYWNRNEVQDFWRYQEIDTIHIYVDSMEHRERISKKVSKMVLNTNKIIVCYVNSDAIKRISYDSKGVVFDSIELENYYDNANDIFVFKVD